MAVEHVAADHHPAAVLDGGKVELRAGPQHVGARNGLAVHAKARHATIRENAEAQVRDAVPV